MIFKPVLVEQILRGRKTRTKRFTTHQGGRDVRYKVGGVYAVQPGRGKHHVAHIEILTADVHPLGTLTPEEAREEGFPLGPPDEPCKLYPGEGCYAYRERHVRPAPLPEQTIAAMRRYFIICEPCLLPGRDPVSEFEEYWYMLHGEIDRTRLVADYSFRRAPNCDDCHFW